MKQDEYGKHTMLFSIEAFHYFDTTKPYINGKKCIRQGSFGLKKEIRAGFFGIP